MLCTLYLKSIRKIVYYKKLKNIEWFMLHSFQETKWDALLLVAAAATYSDEVQTTTTTATTKNNTVQVWELHQSE